MEGQHPPISRLLGMTRPPVARNFWKFGCRPYFLCSWKLPAKIFEIWPLNWNMTPQTNTFVLCLKNHDIIFFSQLTKVNFVQIFLSIEKKTWGHSETFWGVWGQISDTAKSRLIIPQNEALDVSFSNKLISRPKRSSNFKNHEKGQRRSNFEQNEKYRNYTSKWSKMFARSLESF